MLKVATVCSGIGSPEVAINVIIYKAVFSNGKCYIGLTRNGINQRKSEHLYRSKIKFNLPFYHAINKYGWDSIKWEILGEYKSLAEAESAEISFIASNPNNYNVSKGGKASLICDDSRKKISEKLKGRVLTEEWKCKISQTVTKIFSNPENRKKLSQSVKKAMWREDVRNNYLIGIKNRDNSARIQALTEYHKNQKEEKFKQLKLNYIEGMSWESLHKLTGISLVFIRKYKSKWLC